MGRFLAIGVASLITVCTSVVASAQTAQPCIKVPFQASGSTTVGTPDPTIGISYGTISIQLPATPTEIQFATIRLKNPDPNIGADIRSIQLTTTLFGNSVTHGSQIPTAYPSAPPPYEADLSQQVTLYADPSSSIVLNAAMGGAAGAQVILTIVGQRISKSCWVTP